ncbi:hypothetical protein BCL76_11363 [Streptomyces sp. CG 926]|nr:hypothetical protein [Streptomyces sp. CG 926]PWK65076.1 hypothetical protein BCL76_11363 [Streptomyces sp. CG 926]
MPSVVGLLQQRELTAHRRVDELRQEADRTHAELDVAEREWNEWVIARSRVGEVLARGDGTSITDEAIATAGPHPYSLPSVWVCWRSGYRLLGVGAAP